MREIRKVDRKAFEREKVGEEGSKGDTIYVAKDIFSTLRAKIRIHFYLEQCHTQENLSNLIKIVDEIERRYKNE